MPQRTVFRGGVDYMPLLDGRKLVYRETDEGERDDYSLTLHYIGGRNWKIYSVVEEETPYGRIEFESNGVVLRVSTQISLTSLESRKSIGAFTTVWLDGNAPEDSAWFDELTGTETLVAGYENVTVPAGSYTECLKTVSTPLPDLADSLEARYERSEIDEKQYTLERTFLNWQTVRWFASGVGLIKEQIGPPGETKILRELVAVEVEGTGKEDTALRSTTEENNE